MRVIKKVMSMITCLILMHGFDTYAYVKNPNNKVINQESSCYPSSWVTDRLIIEPSKTEDLSELRKMFASYKVSKYMTSVPLQFYSEKHAENFLEKIIMVSYTATYTIKLKEDGQIIGQVAYIIVESNCLELTYWLGENYHGKGYASEAVIELSDYIFAKNCNVSSLKIEFMKENKASKKLANKIISKLLSNNNNYKLEIAPEKKQTMEVVDVLEKSVSLKCESEDNTSEKSVTYFSRSNCMFPKEYMEKGARFNCDECCLYVRKG